MLPSALQRYYFLIKGRGPRSEGGFVVLVLLFHRANEDWNAHAVFS